MNNGRQCQKSKFLRAPTEESFIIYAFSSRPIIYSEKEFRRLPLSKVLKIVLKCGNKPYFKLFDVISLKLYPLVCVLHFFFLMVALPILRWNRSKVWAYGYVELSLCKLLRLCLLYNPKSCLLLIEKFKVSSIIGRRFVTIEKYRDYKLDVTLIRICNSIRKRSQLDIKQSWSCSYRWKKLKAKLSLDKRTIWKKVIFERR